MPNLSRLNIFATTIIVCDAVRLPQTEVNLYCENLIFSGWWLRTRYMSGGLLNCNISCLPCHSATGRCREAFLFFDHSISALRAFQSSLLHRSFSSVFCMGPGKQGPLILNIMLLYSNVV